MPYRNDQIRAETNRPPATFISTESRSEKRKKILVLGPLPPSSGGITTFIMSMFDRRLTEKYQLKTFGTDRPTVGVTHNVLDYTLMLRMGFPVLFKSYVYTFAHLLSFPFVLIKNRPDIVHINTASYWSFWENAIYVYLSRIFGTKTILHIHGSDFEIFYKESNYFFKLLIGLTLIFPEKIIVLSQYWKQLVGKLAPMDKISVITNFVDSSAYDSFPVEKKFSNDKINILFIGGQEAKRKGLYDVINAIQIVTSQNKNVLFVLANCSGVKGLNALCERKKVSSYTKILGYLSKEEKTKVFCNSDLYLLPSYSGGLPISILEAMATGLPIIASSVGSIPEVIQDGKNGFLIEAGDYKALAEKIKLLIRNKDLRQQMAINNVKKIAANYDKNVVLLQLRNEYDKLLEKATA